MSGTFPDQIHTALIVCHFCPKGVAQNHLVCGGSFWPWGQSVSRQTWGANILSSHAKQLPYSVETSKNKTIYYIDYLYQQQPANLTTSYQPSMTTPYLPTSTRYIPHPCSTDLLGVVSAPAHRPVLSSPPLLSAHWEQRQSKVTLPLQLNLQIFEKWYVDY